MSITLNSGSGGATLGTDTVTGSPNVDYQILKIGYSASGVAPTQVSTTNPLPVTLANTGANATAIKVDGSGVTQPVSGTFWQATQPISAASLPLPSGAATSAKQPALGTAGTASADVITVQGIASMTKLLVTPDALPLHQSVNVDQLNGTTADTNSGNKSAGTLRVVIATDQPSLTNAQPVTQSGTWTVQPGNTANTTAWLVTDVPTAGQGASVNSQLQTSSGVVNANIKASSGSIYSIDVTNNNSTPVFARLYDKATAPATTDTPIWRGIVPGNSGAAGMVRVFGKGLKTANGIGVRITGAIADNDATNVNNVAANVEYA